MAGVSKHEKPILEWTAEDSEAYGAQEDRVLAGEMTLDDLIAWMMDYGLAVDPLIVHSIAQALADKDADKTGIRIIY